MFPLLIALAISSASSASADTALALCKPRLAHQVEGDISSISADSVTRRGTSTTVHGQMRALIGMGEPAPGMVSTHHLRREDYRFTCWVRAGRVRKVSLTPLG